MSVATLQRSNGSTSRRRPLGSHSVQILLTLEVNRHTSILINRCEVVTLPAAVSGPAGWPERLQPVQHWNRPSPWQPSLPSAVQYKDHAESQRPVLADCVMQVSCTGMMPSEHRRFLTHGVEKH